MKHVFILIFATSLFFSYDITSAQTTKTTKAATSDLAVFWKEFKNSVIKKDNANIVKLTHFPFLVMNNITNKEEFLKQNLLNDNVINEIKTAKLPTVSKDNFIKMKDIFYSKGSLFITNPGEVYFYFSKINGEWKFVKIDYAGDL